MILIWNFVELIQTPYCHKGIRHGFLQGDKSSSLCHGNVRRRSFLNYIRLGPEIQVTGRIGAMVFTLSDSKGEWRKYAYLVFSSEVYLRRLYRQAAQQPILPIKDLKVREHRMVFIITIAILFYEFGEEVILVLGHMTEKGSASGHDWFRIDFHYSMCI